MGFREFSKDAEVRLTSGCSAKVVCKLGEGGQGTVYKVLLDGREYALKWYHPNLFENKAAFKGNLENNIRNGAPAPCFLWPLYMTEELEGSFGYVMELRPQRFRDFSDFLLAREHFGSLGAVVNAALNITNGFRDLHRKAHSYQDLTDANFFIDPSNGDVLICDNDNVAPYGTSLGIAGKARYMAPEVVRHKSSPDMDSDKFSLAVILFRLLFMDHPLEGERIIDLPCMTEALELKLYGKDPIFIFDPKDRSNRPNPRIHRNVVKLWNFYPEFVREKFIRSFSKDAMDAEDRRKIHDTRLLDNDWQTTFIDLRGRIARCSCGSEIFLSTKGDTRCVMCNSVIPKPRVLNCPNSRYLPLPLVAGTRLYGCHIHRSSDDYRTVCGTVEQNPRYPGVLGIRNEERSRTWKLHLKDGSDELLEFGRCKNLAKIEHIEFTAGAAGEVQ